MSHLLTFSPGWTLPVPAGTMLVRLDIAFKVRPGAGGFALILEAADLDELILVRGSVPHAHTEELVACALANLASEIGANRALILTRNHFVAQQISDQLKPFRMLRILASHPLAVADATRHAAIMAERADYTTNPETERMMASRKIEPEDHDVIHDAAPILKALQTLVRNVEPDKLDDPALQEKATNLLSAANESRLRRLARKIGKIVRNDIPTTTKAE